MLRKIFCCVTVLSLALTAFAGCRTGTFDKGDKALSWVTWGGYDSFWVKRIPTSK